MKSEVYTSCKMKNQNVNFLLKTFLYPNNLYICSVTMSLFRNISDISILKSPISGISFVSISTTTTTTP